MAFGIEKKLSISDFGEDFEKKLFFTSLQTVISSLKIKPMTNETRHIGNKLEPEAKKFYTAGNQRQLVMRDFFQKNAWLVKPILEIFASLWNSYYLDKVCKNSYDMFLFILLDILRCLYIHNGRKDSLVHQWSCIVLLWDYLPVLFGTLCGANFEEFWLERISYNC